MATLTTGTSFANDQATGYVVSDGFSGPGGAAAAFPNGIAGSTPISGDVNAITLTVKGTGTGTTAITSGLTSTSTNTLALPVTATDTLAALGTVQTFTAAQTFTNSDFKLLGSSTGATTFTSANASATNYTLTFPAATDTVVLLGATQTLTAKTLTAPAISNPTISGLTLLSSATPAAAGSTVTDATQLAAVFNAVTGANGTTGVKLPATPAAGTFVVIKNNAGSTLKVWPDAAATINAIGSNADLPMLTNTAALLFATSATQWWSVPLVPS